MSAAREAPVEPAWVFSSPRESSTGTEARWSTSGRTAAARRSVSRCRARGRIELQKHRAAGALSREVLAPIDRAHARCRRTHAAPRWRLMDDERLDRIRLPRLERLGE